MNYYERHIGDYIKDTVSLSMMEDGAYNRLIDQCYQTERPLPLEIKEIYREARANTPAERKAVDYVLGKFFERTAEGYSQKRIGMEIERYQAKRGKAKASANARWNKEQSHSDGNANASETQGALGMRTHSVGNALQTPDTNHQAPGKEKGARKRTPVFAAAGIDLPDWLDRDAWARWCKDRADRRKPVTEEGAKGQLRKLGEYHAAGCDPAAVLDYAITNGHQGFFMPMAPAAPGGRVNRQQALEDHNLDVADAWARGEAHA